MNYIFIFEHNGEQRLAQVYGTLTDDSGANPRLVVLYLSTTGMDEGEVALVRCRDKYEVAFFPTLKDLLRFASRGWRIPEKK